MIKKYTELFKESVKLAFAYPQYALFFMVINLFTLTNSMDLEGGLLAANYAVGFLARLLVLAAVGYITIKLLRTGQKPERIFAWGVKPNLMLVLKYTVLQLVIWTVTSFVPLFFLSTKMALPPIGTTLWNWFMDYVFIFLTFEALFWEDKGLNQAYKTRNMYMLGKYEWIFLVYAITKVPHVLVFMAGSWIYSWPGMLLQIIFLGALDWVSNIFTFKVYGADRLQVIEEVQSKIKEYEKADERKKRDRKK